MTKLWAGWLEFDSWQPEGNFSLHHHIQTSSWGPPNILSNK